MRCAIDLVMIPLRFFSDRYTADTLKSDYTLGAYSLVSLNSLFDRLDPPGPDNWHCRALKVKMFGRFANSLYFALAFCFGRRDRTRSRMYGQKMLLATKVAALGRVGRPVPKHTVIHG